ncbi:hypothetical protein BCR44DRAFT_1447966 [Catenaria anguillulae PL171]|uniref:Uncharacterized protein n=1 Tax=Catenaria anguillulae PL171 TaxID=765915 RepID=A0A1Y2H6Z8_9FUNG|nr:hypothetical protein BCR44DRAFT_1447966 [Catenaria anguillulae PL171]
MTTASDVLEFVVLPVAATHSRNWRRHKTASAVVVAALTSAIAINNFTDRRPRRELHATGGPSLSTDIRRKVKGPSW